MRDRKGGLLGGEGGRSARALELGCWGVLGGFESVGKQTARGALRRTSMAGQHAARDVNLNLSLPSPLDGGFRWLPLDELLIP